MAYQRFCQEELHQIYVHMKDENPQSQITQLMNWHKSIISLELGRNTGNLGCLP
jgi:IS30 family transposase